MSARLWSTALAACVLFAAQAAHAAASGRSGDIAIDPILGKAGAGALFLWIAYGTSMSNYLNETGAATALAGRYEPTFDAEVTGRTAQARAWRELNQSKPERSVYGDDLLRIQDAGFIREYVWHYYRRPAWGDPPGDLRLDEFRRWARDQLATHVPWTGVNLLYKDPASAAAP